MNIEPTSRSALALYLDVVARTPGWVNRLMALRNRVVGLFGLKNLGHLNGATTLRPAGEYKLGDRVGIFSILYLSEAEVILGDTDKHLKVRVSVRKLGEPRSAIAVSTVVHIHNLLGRFASCPPCWDGTGLAMPSDGAAPQPELHARLVLLVRSSAGLMAALRAVRELGLDSWCIGAGAVRSLVWDTLHGYTVPSPPQNRHSPIDIPPSAALDRRPTTDSPHPSPSTADPQQTAPI
eukprot:gene27324-34024_t